MSDHKPGELLAFASEESMREYVEKSRRVMEAWEIRRGHVYDAFKIYRMDCEDRPFNGCIS